MNYQGLIMFAILGAVFWLNAALIIRFFGETVFSQNSPYLFLFYILAIPLTLISILIVKLISGRKFNDMILPVVIMTFTATFLDAFALTSFRDLYSASFEVAMHGAAWILWGVGLGLFFAFVFYQKCEIKSAPENQKKEFE